MISVKLVSKDGKFECVSDRTIVEMEGLLRKLATYPQYRQYVATHTLAKIDGELGVIDELLDRGLVKVPETA